MHYQFKVGRDPETGHLVASWGDEGSSIVTEGRTAKELNGKIADAILAHLGVSFDYSDPE